MDITRSRSVSSSSVSHRASSCSRSPPQRRRITPQLRFFNEGEAYIAAEGHKVTRSVKGYLGRLLSNQRGARQRRACAATGSDLRVHSKMEKGKSHSSTTTKSPTNDGGKAGELFAAKSLEEYAEFSGDNEDGGDSENEDLKKENERLKMKYNEESSARKQLCDEVIEGLKGIL